MGLLTFTYGTMGSSKTANLLMNAHNYRERGFLIRLIKPAIDTRDAINVIKSRIGIQAEPVETIAPNETFENKNIKTNEVLFIDEAQFLTKAQVEELRQLAFNNVVYCYGLLTDFKSAMFEGSKRLVELADNVVLLESICECGRKTIINARLLDGQPVYNGPQLLIGGSETYKSMCYHCWVGYKNKKKQK